MAEQEKDAPQGASPQAPSPKAPPKKKARRVPMFKDPLVRGMAWAAAALVILYLITIVSALVMGVLGTTAPRTIVERDSRVYEAAVRENPGDLIAWRRYISSLINTNQMTAAQEAIDRGLEAVKDEQSETVATAQVELYLATDRFEEGIKLADEIRVRLKAYYDKAKETPDSPESKGAEIDENYWNLLLMKAEAFVELNDTPAAIEALDEYLTEKPAAADVLIRRGSLKADQGDKEGAEKDFRAALLFLPNDAAALEGLKKIGVEE